MKSDLPKILHPLLGKPIIAHVTDMASAISELKRNIIVIARHSEMVRDIVKGERIEYAYQKAPLGTADAVKSGLNAADSSYDHILILNGDVPLIKVSTIKSLIAKHTEENNDLTVLSFIASVPGSYGRVTRDDSGNIRAIVEEKDATSEEKKIDEVNSGIYLIGNHAAGFLSHIKKNEKKGEYYLTDIISICHEKGMKVSAHCVDDESEFLGVNSRSDLLTIQKILQKEIHNHFLQKGVSLMGEDSIIIHPTVDIEKDTRIYPNVILEGNTYVGQGSIIYPGVRVVNSEIGKNVVIKDNSLIENTTVPESTTIEPFTYLKG